MYEIIELSNQHKKLAKILKKFNVKIPAKMVYAYAIFEENNAHVMIFTRVNLDVDYQWQLYYYSDVPDNKTVVQLLWNTFCKKHHVSSCVSEVVYNGSDTGIPYFDCLAYFAQKPPASAMVS